MKNREKYKNELMDVIKKDGMVCEFVKKHEVYRMFENDSNSYCKMACATCSTALNLWLDEEYEEPPKPEVDWDNVPVDTLVRVRYYEDDEWLLRYFKGFSRTPSEYPPEYNYEAWESGATSKTANGKYFGWKYCELVEDEDK